MKSPFEIFCDELDALIDKWRDKPLDDRPSYAEYIAALEFRKYKLLHEAYLAGQAKEAQ